MDTWWYVAVDGIGPYGCIASGPAVLCCSPVLCWIRSAAACRTCQIQPIDDTLRQSWCRSVGGKRPQRQEPEEQQQEGTGRKGQLFSLFPFFLQLWCCCAFNRAPRAAETAYSRISIALTIPTCDRRTWARPVRMRSTPFPPKTWTRATKAGRYPSHHLLPYRSADRACSPIHACAAHGSLPLPS